MNNLEILSPLERDMLGELLNVGIASAAVSLSQIIKQEVKLSVPKIAFLSAEEMAEKLGGDCLISSVSRHVSGPFEAQSMLLFPKKSSVEVVRKMLGEDVPLDMINDVHQEAFIEIGNIMIQACIDAISEVLNVSFKVSPADYQAASPYKLIPMTIGSEQAVILDAGIDFTLSNTAEKGALVFLLGPISLEGLKKSINDILSKFSTTPGEQ